MIRRAFETFVFSLTVLMMPVLSNAQGVVAPASGPENRITILYDAFGKDPSMRKDWGFSALVPANAYCSKQATIATFSQRT
jgi:hypothetical protein